MWVVSLIIIFLIVLILYSKHTVDSASELEKQQVENLEYSYAEISEEQYNAIKISIKNLEKYHYEFNFTGNTHKISN